MQGGARSEEPAGQAKEGSAEERPEERALYNLSVDCDWNRDLTSLQRRVSGYEVEAPSRLGRML
jgi:hypothetical protein